jgi:hypothetical protein
MTNVLTVRAIAQAGANIVIESAYPQANIKEIVNIARQTGGTVTINALNNPNDAFLKEMAQLGRGNVTIIV